MSGYSSPILNDELSKRTVVFGLHLWVVVGICVGAAFVLLLFLISLWIASKRPKTSNHGSNSHNPIIPSFSKEIQVIPADPKTVPESNHSALSTERQSLLVPQEEESPIGLNRIHINIGKDHRITYPERGSGAGAGSSGESRSVEQVVVHVPEVSHLGWGHWYTLRELEAATNMFADENVIGEGGYGIVYHGVLGDNTQIAVKNLLNNRYPFAGFGCSF